MTAGNGTPAAREGSRRALKFSITTALALGFGTLLVAGMTVVLGISMWSAQKNTRELLANYAQIAVLSLVRETRRRLSPVEETSAYLGQMISSDRIDLADRDGVAKTLLIAMAGTPQVFGMAFVYPDGSAVRVRRGYGVIPDVRPSDDFDVRGAIDQAQRHDVAFWGRPVWLPAAKSSVVSVRTPIWYGDRFLGMVVAGVTVNELSQFIARSAAVPVIGNRFILYGRDHVLAHANMANGGYRRNEDVALPRLDQIDDPAVAKIWNAEDRRGLLISLDSNTRGHGMTVDGETFIYLYRELSGFGDRQLIVGIYAGPDDGLGVEINRLIWAGAAGIGVIVLCVGGAVALGRRMSAPIRDLAEGSRAVADLELDRVTELKPSRLRELDEAAAAFNRMTAGLRWFETYVPRELVRRLITRDAQVTSEEKLVTVMFTDIVGFSTISEHMPAAGTAQLLNDHFSILAACIEAEHGTVDKYIGDSVMAFWEPEDGGPDVDRAIRAAQRIGEGVRADNAQRRAEGRPAVAVRIGIHTGRAIVGNIGAPGRINYTLVGDTVNVAARLEQLCKELDSDRDATVLVSGETVALAGDRTGMTPRGSHPVRGRDGAIDVYSLDV